MNQKEMLLAMKNENNFKKFGILLELYALEAFEKNEFGASDPSMKQLKEMLSEHVLHDYYIDKDEKEPWYIRSGNKALLMYAYCSLSEWFPHPDIGNVFRIGEKMHYGYKQMEKGIYSLDEEKIRHIMAALDEKYQYSDAVFGENAPVILTMDVTPIYKKEFSLRRGCEQIYKGFVVWRYSDNILPVPPETAFLLNLSDCLLYKARILNEGKVYSMLLPKLEEAGYGWVLKERGANFLYHLGDMVCIGLACDTPLFRYMPFSGQSRIFRDCCSGMVKDLLEVVRTNDLHYSLPFL